METDETDAAVAAANVAAARAAAAEYRRDSNSDKTKQTDKTNKK